MLIEQALTTYLLANSGVKALIGDRLYLGHVSKEKPKAPYVVMERPGSPEVSSHDGPAGLVHPLFQFTAYASTYIAATTIAAALKSALDGYSGTMGGVGGLTVRIPQRDDEYDDYDTELKLYAMTSEYTVWYQEA